MTLSLNKPADITKAKEPASVSAKKALAGSSSNSLSGLSQLKGTGDKDSVGLSTGVGRKTTAKSKDWLDALGEKRAWMDGLSNLEFARDGIKDAYSPEQQQFLNQLNTNLDGTGLKVRITAATTDKGHSDGQGGEHKTGLGLDIGFANLSDAQQKQLGGILAKMDTVDTVGTTQHEKAIDEAAGDPTKGRYLKAHSDHFHVMLKSGGETAVKLAKPTETSTAKTPTAVSSAVSDKLEQTKNTIAYKALMQLMVRKMEERAAQNGHANPELLSMVMDTWLAEYFSKLEASGQALPDVADVNSEGSKVLERAASDFVLTGSAAQRFGQLKDTIAKASAKYNVNPALLSALLKQESGFKQTARSSAGAQGIAQFMPATAKRYGVDTSDPVSSIYGAAHYLSDNLNRFGGDEAKALAAYNAGEGAVAKYGGVPPYKETQNYVKSILAGKSHFEGEFA